MLQEFIADGVIEECSSTDEEKKYRMILNVKQLNFHVDYIHFKMDTLDSCLLLMDRNCFMASVDLENAYHSVPMHPDYTKYFKFSVNGKMFKYLVLPQGYRE